MNNPKWADELVRDLTKLADPNNPNRAVLADLRRGLTGPSDYALARAGWLFQRVPEHALDDAVLAAGLFAWAKARCPHEPGINFGAAFGSGLSSDEKQRREKRFLDLLDTDQEELPYKLRQAITLIGESARLDWTLLIRHLNHWNNPERWVQRQWARGFWGAATEEPSVSSVAAE